MGDPALSHLLSMSLQGFPGLSHLSLALGDLYSADFCGLAALPHLTSLDISDSTNHEAGIRHLTALTQLTQVRHTHTSPPTRSRILAHFFPVEKMEHSGNG